MKPTRTRALGALLIAALLSLTLAAAGCSYRAVEQDLQAEQDSLQRALQVTQRELTAMRQDPASGWTDRTILAGATPISLPGVDGVSYVEVKVQTDGADSGYILVNTNDTDVEIPEVATQGPTLTERYRRATGRDDLRVVRYSWFASAALEDDGALVASIGLGGAPQLTLHAQLRPDQRQRLAQLHQTYAAKVRQRGSSPSYDRALEIRPSESAEAESGAAGVGLQRQSICYDHSTKRTYLKKMFRSGRRLPAWTQPHDTYHYPVGCGNTAWAMVYAYWQHFKGKSNLFGGTNMDALLAYNPSRYRSDEIGCHSGVVYDVMWELSRLTRTTFGGGSKLVSKYGLTLPWDMHLGIQYARNNGYHSATVQRVQGAELFKFGRIEAEIKADRPAILLIHADGIGAANHYIGIEGTKRINRGCLPPTLGYWSNFGHGAGQANKWIYTQFGSPLHSAFSAYLIQL